MKRASLANLSSRLANKGAAATSEPAEGATAADAAPAKRNRQPDGRKGILVRARPEAWKALKLIALDQELTLQDAMTTAINDYLTKHGKPPVA